MRKASKNSSEFYPPPLHISESSMASACLIPATDQLLLATHRLNRRLPQQRIELFQIEWGSDHDAFGVDEPIGGDRGHRW